MRDAEQSVSELMTLEEGARFLRLKEATLRAWRLKEQITVVKLGRKIFVRRSDLEALITHGVVPARGQNERWKTRSLSSVTK